MSKTPIERGAEALHQHVHPVPYCGWPDASPEHIANYLGQVRAVFESIDREGLARVLREHEPPLGMGSEMPGDEFDCCADAILAWLTEGGAS